MYATLRAGMSRILTLNLSGLCRGGRRSRRSRWASCSTVASSSSPRALRHALMSNALGGTPKRCLKHREKSDDEENPHASAIEVSDGARERAIRPSALSRRRRFTNSAGVAPTRAWNTRWKWNGESIAARDRSRSRSGSWRWLTTWSMARLTRSIYVAVVAKSAFLGDSQDLASPPLVSR